MRSEVTHDESTGGGAARLRRWLPAIGLAIAVAITAVAAATGSAAKKTPRAAGTVQKLRLIHLSDTHGKFVPHAEHYGGRWDRNSGGFAKSYGVVERLRRTAPGGKSMLLLTGDNFSGSGELFFSRGRAVAPILNAFRADAYSPGNWDFADGPAEVRARFVGTPAEPKLLNAPALAAGVYNAPGAPPDAKVGERLLPPYLIKRVGGLDVALLGLNDDKPMRQADVFSVGLDFKAGWDGLPRLLREVRARGADLVVAMSEAGLAQNIAIGRDYPGIDVILSGDTHESTRKPIVVEKTGTIVVESGEGSSVGQLDLSVVKGSGRGGRARVADARWKLNDLGADVPEDPGMKELVAKARAPFVSGPGFTEQVRVYPGWKPGTGMRLSRPLDTKIGTTDGDLERAQVFEGLGDNVIADALREMSGADIGGTNGFRYDVGVPAGDPITIGDVYTWLPVGAHVAVGEMTGGQILDRFERYLSATLDPNPYRRSGGWVPRLSGLRFYVDLTGPHGPAGDRIVKAEVLSRTTGNWEPLVEDKVYTLASCYSPGDPLDSMCRTSGVRNMRFLRSDLTLAAPLISSMPPNPLPKKQAAPNDVLSIPELLLRYIEQKGGVRRADHADRRWIIVRGKLPTSKLAPHVVQPLQGSGPDWLAAKRVGGEQ